MISIKSELHLDLGFDEKYFVCDTQFSVCSLFTIALINTDRQIGIPLL